LKANIYFSMLVSPDEGKNTKQFNTLRWLRRKNGPLIAFGF
jgi:hypothetical protein